MSTSFNSYSKYKLMVSNYNINRIDTVNNNKKINSSNAANTSCSISMVTNEVPAYQIIDVNDEKAEAAKPLLAKGYTQEIIDNYFDYKDGEYTIKNGYEIKTNNEYVDSLHTASATWDNGLKTALFRSTRSNAVCMATGSDLSNFIGGGVKINSSFVVLKNGEPVAACCTIEKNGKTEQYFKNVK